MTSLYEVMDSSVFLRLSDFSVRYCGKGIDREAMFIDISLGRVSIFLGLNDRYYKGVSNFIKFEDGVTFSFTSVFAAINRLDNLDPIMYREGEDIKKHNNRYVNGCIDFYESHMNAILEFPPSWFLEASKIDKKITERNSPSLAKYYFDKEIKLWNKWHAELM